jgi:hypothetical protein
VYVFRQEEGLCQMLNFDMQPYFDQTKRNMETAKNLLLITNHFGLTQNELFSSSNCILASFLF